MKRTAHQPAKGGLELIEEATHLLRKAPAHAWLIYSLGSVPFVLAGLYFWADMSRGAFAAQRLTGAALGMAVLFLWLKFCHALFLCSLHAEMAGGERPALTPARCANLFITQTALQPTGLFLLPLALVPALPFGWVYAFYQNLSALADGDSAELRPLVKKAIQQAGLWPRQNHVFLAIMSGFGCFIFLNWATVCFLLPGLFKMLFGVESIFTRSGVSTLNTTFFAVVTGLTYLCVDPILKASYALRCFYGTSLESGADLKAELRPFTIQVKHTSIAALVMLGLLGIAGVANGRTGERGIDARRDSNPDGTCGNSPSFQGWFLHDREISPEGTAESGCYLGDISRPFGTRPFSPVIPTLKRWAIFNGPSGTCQGPSARESAALLASRSGALDMEATYLVLAASAGEMTHPSHSAAMPAPGGSPGVSPQELDRAIRKTMRQPKYTWRMPREKLIETDAADQGILSRFLSRANKLVGQWLEDFARWFGEWIRKLFGRQRPISPAGSGYGWIIAQELLTYGLVVLAAAGLSLLAYRLWRGRWHAQVAIASEPVQPAPDLSDENIGAERLPEDGWLRLARELLGRGELRLALRAFYLASLAHLAGRNLISLAKFKSNRDYELELRRRSHTIPELLALFGENVSIFDRTWYGLHDTSREAVDQFAANVERIRSTA